MRLLGVATVPAVLSMVAIVTALPDLRDSLRKPIQVEEGRDALMTCVVRDLGNYTVVWKKETSNNTRHKQTVLTAGEYRVTADPRIMVIHDQAPRVPLGSKSPAGDVWVLAIKGTRPSDAGVYICEVNSSPILRSFHKLDVLVKISPNTTVAPPAFNHNFTTCCIIRNISSQCLPFCSLTGISEIADEELYSRCDPEFPKAARCMADGRDHLPCCVEHGVPDICQGVCRGEYKPQTDAIKDHYSCEAYSEVILTCVAEGINVLPPPARGLRLEALSDSELKVSWLPPRPNSPPIDYYLVNVTRLKTFDDFGGEESTNTSIVNPSETVTPTTMQVRVPAPANASVVPNLTSYTMYEVSVISYNDHGSSLSEYSLRGLTLSPNFTQRVPEKAPLLPNVRQCCADKGVTEGRCLDNMCDPANTSNADMTDLIVCAPWAQDTFSCMANGRDHTDCCRERGLPSICVDLCDGNVTKIDYRYFRCLRYMSVYTGCLLQGYGVVPGPPKNLAVSSRGSSYVILDWDLPDRLGDTVVAYNIYFRQARMPFVSYVPVAKIQPPYVLEHLNGNMEYEVYLEAVNEHGQGDPSARIIFKTLSAKVESALNEDAYNVSSCCVLAEVSADCLPLCSYDARMSHLMALGSLCAPEFHKVLRCKGGGRNHRPCCQRRGVPKECEDYCIGSLTPEHETSINNQCFPYIGNIVQCYEDGTGLLPPPTSILHATDVSNNSVTLAWDDPDNSNVTFYQVFYQKRDHWPVDDIRLALDEWTTTYANFTSVNVTNKRVTVTGLESNVFYSFFVVSWNDAGSSVPSSVLTLNVSESLNGSSVTGVASHVHGLQISSRSATFLTVSWAPPLLSHPTDRLRYRLYFRKVGQKGGFDNVTTIATSVTLEDLTPNSEYIIYVTSLSDHGESTPSQTLLAWTDPAYPAFVEEPTIHPTNLVVEGGSMTVLCIAMGAPLPTVSLYISGRLVHEDNTRHMVTILKNISRDMSEVTCYADNGVGSPMQASRNVLISRRPILSGPELTLAAAGDSAVLKCEIDAYPRPSMMFWRDAEGRVPVIHGGNFQITTTETNVGRYEIELQVVSVTPKEAGRYYCHAENAFGSFTQTMELTLKEEQELISLNVTECCRKAKVSESCIDACSFDVDIDAVVNRPQCIPEFNKLMRCASDGSDHRRCCSKAGVPRRCIDWCRGDIVPDSSDCVLGWVKDIVKCFEEGKEVIPGLPQKIRVESINPTDVRISWDPPLKNNEVVELYRVYWRPVGFRDGQKQDTKITQMIITGLKTGTEYETAVKAGNHYGTSQLTSPYRFTPGEKYVTSANTQGTGSNAGTVIGVILLVLCLVGLAIGGVWYIRKKQLLSAKSPSSNGVSFENPSYLREGESGQVNTIGDGLSATTNGGSSVGNGGSGEVGWNSEPLQSVTDEPNDRPLRELRLGHDGAGFKKFTNEN